MDALNILCNSTAISIETETHKKEYEIVVRRRKSTVTLRCGTMKLMGKVYDRTFVIEIDTCDAMQAHSVALPMCGFGAHLYIDYAIVATEIARQFCKEENMHICTEFSHFPLQFVAEIPSGKS